MKVCVVGVYFGKYPEFIDLWINSCEKNEKIDFWVFGDAALPRVPGNVHQILLSLEEMKKIAEEKLGERIILDKPYKCCDYKPLYGYIFSDYLSEYDYCGYCDFDVLFGDISSFLEKYDLYQYDKFLTLGHLSFIRNTKEIYECILHGKQNDSYHQMINTDKTIQFDELTGINTILSANGYRIFQDRIYADISRLWKRIKLAEKYIDSKDVNYPQQLFYWFNGKVYRAFKDSNKIVTEEYIYIHLKKRKYRTPNMLNPNLVIISPNNLFCFDDEKYEPTIKDIKNYNRYYGKLYEWIELTFLSRNPNHIAPDRKRELQ